MAVQLSSRFLTTLVVNGKTYAPTATGWQTFTGGGVTGDSAASRPPGAEFPRQPGGEKTIQPITIGCDADYSVLTEDDMLELQAMVGVENAAFVSRKKLDANRNPFGKGRTWVCTITGVHEPDSDTNTDNEKAVITIDLQPSSRS